MNDDVSEFLLAVTMITVAITIGVFLGNLLTDEVRRSRAAKRKPH